MAQDLTVNIKTTSDVPDAMNKAKAATSGFDKQVEGIGKKFSGSFKDIFLSFLGPMALLGTVMSFIGNRIAENKKKQEDANQAAIDGTNALMSAEDRYYANKLNNEKKTLATADEALNARSKVTKDFLENDPRGRDIFADAFREKTFGQPFRKYTPGLISDDPAIQEKVQALIAEDMKKNPLPNAGKDFTAPAGFSNVIGVGANPVLEAVTAQLEEARIHTALLQQIADKGQPPSADFTKDPKPDPYGK